jgi:hypothetical protein
MGMGSSLETILEQFPEMQTASIYTTDTQKKTVNVATGEETDTEIGTPGEGGTIGGGDDPSNPGQTVEKIGVTHEISASDVYAKAQTGALTGKLELASDKSYTRFFASTQHREVYFTAFKKDSVPSGKYLIIKYRTEDPKARFEIWASSENLGATGGDNKTILQSSGAIIADGEWHNLILDLSGWKTVSDYNGIYDINYVRFDLFDYDKPAADESAWIDIAYMTFCDDYDKAIAYDEAVSVVQVYNGSTLTTVTGKEDNGGITHEISASDIYAKAQGSVRMGKLELASDKSYARFFASVEYREIYFTAFKKDSVPSGRYLIFKYRTEDKNAKLEFWASTENAGATAGDNKYLYQNDGVIIADGEWHTLILDLSGWATVSEFNGQYDINYVRFDLFDYDKPAADESAWIDVAYIAFSNDYDAAVSYDETASYVLVYNGSALTTVDKTQQ